MIDAIDVLAKPLKADLQRFGQRQAGCRALVNAQYGIGGLLAVAIWSELGDCRRFTRSDQVVRHSGLDVTVDSSDRRRASGFLSRQGPETLRWALYEAAKNSSHHRSPDHDYYAAVKERHDRKLAAIAMAARSPAVPSTFYAPSTPTRCTPHRRQVRSVATVDTAHHLHRGFAYSSFNRRARQHSCWTALEH
jgi:transposase